LAENRAYQSIEAKAPGIIKFDDAKDGAVNA
jgi:hypothetical protein